MRNATRMIALIYSIILICTVFVSCGNTSINENTIIGKWSYVFNGNTNTIEFLENGSFYITTYRPLFSDDNKNGSTSKIEYPTFPSVISGYTPCNYTGNYVINGEKITMTYEDSGIKQKLISTFEVNDTTLTITTDGTESSGIVTVPGKIEYKRTK